MQENSEEQLYPNPFYQDDEDLERKLYNYDGSLLEKTYLEIVSPYESDRSVNLEFRV
jgi:hypothetical protein